MAKEGKLFLRPGYGWLLLFFCLAQAIMGWLLWLRMPDAASACFRLLAPLSACALLALWGFPRLRQDTAIPILILLLLTVCYAIQLLRAQQPEATGQSLMGYLLIALALGAVAYVLGDRLWPLLTGKPALILYSCLSLLVFALLAVANIAGRANTLFSGSVQPLSLLRFAALLSFAILLQRGPQPQGKRVLAAIALFLFYVIGMILCNELGFTVMLTVVFLLLLLYTYPGVGGAFALLGVALAGLGAGGCLLLKRLSAGWESVPVLAQKVLYLWDKVCDRFIAVTYRNPSGSQLEEFGAQLYQFQKAKAGMSRGGLFGALVHGDIPVADSDMVLAALVESLGLLIALLVLILSLVLVLRIFQYGFRSSSRLDVFHLYCSGLAILYACQVLLICCGVLQLLPLTGVPLPFVSRSGTDLCCYCGAIGLMLGGYSYARRRQGREAAGLEAPWFLGLRGKEGKADASEL